MSFSNYTDAFQGCSIYRVNYYYAWDKCLEIFKASVSNMKGMDKDYASRVASLTASDINNKIFYAPVYNVDVYLSQSWTTERDKTVRDNTKYSVESSSPGQILSNHRTYSVNSSYTQTVTTDHSATKSAHYIEHVGTYNELNVKDKSIFNSSKNTVIRTLDELKYPLYSTKCIIPSSQFSKKAYERYCRSGRSTSVDSTIINVYFVPIIQINFTFRNKGYAAYVNMYNGAIYHDVVANKEALDEAYRTKNIAKAFSIIDVVLCSAAALFNVIFAFAVKGHVFFDIVFCLIGVSIFGASLGVQKVEDFDYYRRFYTKNGEGKSDKSHIKTACVFVFFLALNVFLHIILGC